MRTTIFLGVMTLLSNGLQQQPEEARRNRLVGKPIVSCQPNAVSIIVKVDGIFDGWIYVKHQRHNEKCSKLVRLAENSTRVRLDVGAQQLIQCGFQVWPKPNSKSSLVSGQIVIAFHRRLITPSDQAFAIHCEFDNVEKSIEHPNDVIAFEDTINQLKIVNGYFKEPEITMDVVAAASSKNASANVKIGDSLVFSWRIEEKQDLFGIHLEMCRAENADGIGMEIIENGCSLDHDLIPDVIVSKHHNLIVANANAFKFPDDESIVVIRCRIRVCFANHHLRIGKDASDEATTCDELMTSCSSTHRGRRQLRRPSTATTSATSFNSFTFEKAKRFRKNAKSSSHRSKFYQYICATVILLRYL